EHIECAVLARAHLRLTLEQQPAWVERQRQGAKTRDRQALRECRRAMRAIQDRRQSLEDGSRLIVGEVEPGTGHQWDGTPGRGQGVLQGLQVSSWWAVSLADRAASGMRRASL